MLVCAHELAHCLYHQLDSINFLLNNTKIVRRSYLEREANQFAVELLYDDIVEDYEKCDDIDLDLLEQIREMKK